MEIRRADRTDLSAIVEITQRAYAIWLPDLGYPPVPVTEDYAPRIDRGEVWLACSGNKPTALIVLERAANHDMIFSVAVDPTYAGQGLGQHLITFAEERARAAVLGEIRLYTNALMKPVWRRGKPDALLHHSDQGSQGGFKWSSQHSERGGCDEHSEAAVGSVWAGATGVAWADVFDYIERFYNTTRRHSTIGYLSPVEFENRAELA